MTEPDLSPDALMEAAWNRSEGYHFQGRDLHWTRAHFVLAESIGLNMRHAMSSARDGQVTYDGVLEDIGIILYVASLDSSGLRKARRNKDMARDAACEIFDAWDIPLSGPVFDEAQKVAMDILTDVSDSRTTTDSGDETNDQEEHNDDGKKR